MAIPSNHTAPPAPHGVRDLLLGLVAALLLSGLLGCATPARLAERPVSQHDYLDSRTKHAEPVPPQVK